MPLANRTTSPRCDAGCNRAASAATSDSGTSNSSATAVAARMFARFTRPMSGVVPSTPPRGDLRPLPQLHEGPRQPDVVVEVPAVANDAVPTFEKLARHLLRRRLAGAAGDGHNLRWRLAPNPVRQRLKRGGRVVDFDDDRPL